MAAGLLLGLGGTVDYEISWDAAVFESLAREYDIRAADLDPSLPVVDERSLVIAALAHVRDSRGGERFVSSVDVLEQFSRRFAFATTLGGTCVRAALVLSAVGIPSTVHLVSIDDTVRAMLPRDVSFVCSATADSTDPHVIVQYPAGAVVRLADAVLTTRHPNRLIFVNDRPNRELRLVPDFARLVTDASVVLVSGFNTIQDAGILEDRLSTVRAAIAERTPGVIAVFEDAGSHDPAHGRRVRDVMSRCVDVYGLNEDELFGYVGGEVDLLDPGAVEHALAELSVLIPAPIIVVHTKHWAAAYGVDAHRWREAVSGGVSMAGTRFRVGDALTMDEFARTEQLARQSPAVEFAHELERRLPDTVCVVPAFALDVDRPTTIGLGDSFVGGFISALAPASSQRPVGAEVTT